MGRESQGGVTVRGQFPPVLSRCHAQVPFELVREGALVTEARRQGYLRGGVPSTELLACPLKTRLHLVSVRRQAHRFSKNPREVKATQPGDTRQIGQTDFLAGVRLQIIACLLHGQPLPAWSDRLKVGL